MTGVRNEAGAVAATSTSAGRGLPPDLGRRVAIAVPVALVTLALIAIGGLPWALALAGLGPLAADELFRMAGLASGPRKVGVAAVALLPLAAFLGGLPAATAVLFATLPAAFFATRGAAQGTTAALATTMLGAAWIGLAAAHGVLLRELPDGERLLVAALLATFIGDTAAHLVGSAIGRHQLAPRISAAKTVEGLVAGIVVGTAAAAVFLAVMTGPVTGLAALAVAVAAALAAPAGDLFESRVKRDFGVKDTGRLLGPHGGALDRIDAVIFAVVAAYYVVLVVT
jgi:phosphatidate cytidylyltransferase